MWKVQLFNLNFDERERDAAAVVEGGWLKLGMSIIRLSANNRSFSKHRAE